MVKRGELSFVEIVKNIRANVNADIIGDTISKIRETRNGNVLIEILGGSDTAERVKKEVEKSLGPGESVRFLEQRTLIQLRDLDCVTTKKDVVEASSSVGNTAPLLMISKSLVLDQYLWGKVNHSTRGYETA